MSIVKKSFWVDSYKGDRLVETRKQKYVIAN